MWDSLDDSPRVIRNLLAERGIALKKRWGQNFMISRQARESIADLAAVSETHAVWEIGPGLGGITAILVRSGARVTVFEVDHGLMRIIADRFGDALRIVAGDAVKTLPEQEPGPDAVVGNLPYRSAAAIISTLLETPHLVTDAGRLVFTVQKEMARRMVADVGTSDYSPFSILCAITTDAELRGDLGKGMFYPAPEVISSIVLMNPRPVDPEIRTLTSIAARALFAQRRKKIQNNLAGLSDRLGASAEDMREACTSAGIDVDARAERVEPAGFVRLAEELRKLGYSGRT